MTASEGSCRMLASETLSLQCHKSAIGPDSVPLDTRQEMQLNVVGVVVRVKDVCDLMTW